MIADTQKRLKIYRGEVWHIPKHPRLGSDPKIESIPDGALAVANDGSIAGVDAFPKVQKLFPDGEIVDSGDVILMPGLIDSHIHFPQMDMVGCYGEKLLGWLDRYAFPEEIKFLQQNVAQEAAGRFFKTLLENGTTTAVIYSNSSYETTSNLFQAADRFGMRAIIGKVSMDRNAPKDLLVDPKKDLDQNNELIRNWKDKNPRLKIALTPRFAISCSEKLLQMLGDLKDQHPELYVQTHFAEMKEEIQLTKKLFKKHKSYLNVYQAFGLLGPKTILAHGIHVTASDLKLLEKTGTSISHCPSSNLFLGSGMLPWNQYRKYNIPISVGTDVGGGMFFSIWKTLAAAYTVQKMQAEIAVPERLFYWATLGAAKSLNLDHEIGSFAVGKRADFLTIQRPQNVVKPKGKFPELTAAESFFRLLFKREDEFLKNVHIDGRAVK